MCVSPINDIQDVPRIPWQPRCDPFHYGMGHTWITEDVSLWQIRGGHASWTYQSATMKRQKQLPPPLPTSQTPLFFCQALESFWNKIRIVWNGSTINDMRGSRKFCQRPECNSDNIFVFSWWGERIQILQKAGHHRPKRNAISQPISETPLKWRFAGMPMMAQWCFAGGPMMA